MSRSDELYEEVQIWKDLYDQGKAERDVWKRRTFVMSLVCIVTILSCIWALLKFGVVE